MEFWARKKKKEKGNPTNWFIENGSMFLQELITDCNGVSNPIRFFSSKQILKATNRFTFDPNSYDPSFIWCAIEDRPYLIKKYYRARLLRLYNDIVLSIRVSNHSGFLKLIGCCLEFRFPVLVFENPEFGVLNNQGSIGCKDAPLLPWSVMDLRKKGAPVKFGGDTNDMRPSQMEMFLDLALRCCKIRHEHRPKMIFVAKELKLIERSLDCNVLETGSPLWSDTGVRHEGEELIYGG